MSENKDNKLTLINEKTANDYLTHTINNRILHIVAGCDSINIYIITAYYPDTKKFEEDLKTRRKGK